MTTPNISIVIPTRNRPQILRQCLDHIEKQTIADQIEVIVVIDGDDPKTAEMLSSLHWSFPLICFAIPKAQQGIARNRGMEKAHGKIVLFIGDDIFLAPDACERHIRAHARKSEIRNPKSEINLKLQTNMHTGSDFVLRASDFPIAVLGFTTWDPAVGITSVMRWLTKTGWQFGYEKIAAYGGKILPSEIQHRFTYTSHISLSRAIAQDFPFHEDVTLYGWEDVEWGIRLRDAGIPLFYEATAHALHHHRTDLRESLERMVTLGQSARIFADLHPGFDRVPHGWKLAAYHLLALFPTLRGKHAKAFLKGLNDKN